MHLWQYVLLFSAVFLGGSIGFFFQKEKRGLLQIILSFSGAYILGIAALHLMPMVFTGGRHEPGIWMLAGFFMQLLLEQLSAGVEHGHIHAPHKLSFGFVFSVMLGLCVHAFVEGIPLSYYNEMQSSLNKGWVAYPPSTIILQPDLNVSVEAHPHNHLLYGIVLHHIPAAFALVFLMLITQLKKPYVWLCLFIFAAMSPLGAAAASIVSIPAVVQNNIIAFVVGSLLHIATVILFEMDSSSHHYISWKKLAAIAAGLGISILTIL